MTRPCTVDLYRSPAKPQLNPLLHFFPNPDMGAQHTYFYSANIRSILKNKVQSVWSVELFNTRRTNKLLLCNNTKWIEMGMRQNIEKSEMRAV